MKINKYIDALSLQIMKCELQSTPLILNAWSPQGWRVQSRKRKKSIDELSKKVSGANVSVKVDEKNAPFASNQKK